MVLDGDAGATQAGVARLTLALRLVAVVGQPRGGRSSGTVSWRAVPLRSPTTRDGQS